MVRLGLVSLSDQNPMEGLRTKGEVVGMEDKVIGIGDEVVTVEEVKMVGFLAEPVVSACRLAYPHHPINEF